MSRIGKIARLDKALRNELGKHIEDGVPGKEIIGWLNAQPKVQKLIKKHFQGQQITEQNLSDWRQGGHLEWLRFQAAREAVSDFVKNTGDLAEEAEESELIAHLSLVFSAQLMQTSMALLAAETDLEKKWKRLCDFHRELSRLRRDEDGSKSVALKQVKWEYQHARQEKEDNRDNSRAGWEYKAREWILRIEAKEKQAEARANKLKLAGKDGEQAGGEKPEEVGHRGTESTEGGKVDQTACADEPVKGRESKEIVADRVKKEGTGGTQGTDGGIGGAGHRTNGRDARSTIPSGEQGPENLQESGQIVANPVKEVISLESPVKCKIVNGERVYEYVPESMEHRLRRLRAIQEAWEAEQAKAAAEAQAEELKSVGSGAQSEQIAPNPVKLEVSARTGWGKVVIEE